MLERADAMLVFSPARAEQLADEAPRLASASRCPAATGIRW